MDQTQSLLALSPGVTAFLDSCLWDKGIKDLPQEMHDQMLQNLAARLEPWLLHAAMMELNEADTKALDEYLETNPPQEQIAAFLAQRIPDINTVFEQAMVEFKQTFLKN